jgi:hypothetical protein
MVRALPPNIILKVKARVDSGAPLESFEGSTIFYLVAVVIRRGFFWKYAVEARRVASTRVLSARDDIYL